MTIRLQALAALLAAAGLFLAPPAPASAGGKAGARADSAVSSLNISGGNVLQSEPGCPACAD